MYFIFPPHLSSASALPGENRKPGNCVFSLKCCMLFHPKTRNIVKNITWLELNHPSLSERSTGCTRQDLVREHSILLSVTHTLCVSHVCHAVSRCVKDGSCSSSSLGYLMSNITDDNFFLDRRQCTGALCNTIQLSEKCDFRVSPFCQVVRKHTLFEVA